MMDDYGQPNHLLNCVCLYVFDYYNLRPYPNPHLNPNLSICI